MEVLTAVIRCSFADEDFWPQSGFLSYRLKTAEEEDILFQCLGWRLMAQQFADSSQVVRDQEDVGDLEDLDVVGEINRIWRMAKMAEKPLWTDSSSAIALL
ncbi:unnamed protein product [Arctogadus glacialis]